MNVSFVSSLLPRCGVRLGAVMALFWLAGIATGRSQWMELVGQTLGPAAIPAETEWLADSVSPVMTLHSATGDVLLRFRAEQDLGLGPIVNLVAPEPGQSAPPAPAETLRERGPMRLGDVIFNRAAESLNVNRGDFAGRSDISRQFGGPAAATGVVQSVPISGVAIGVIAALALIVFLAISFYESDDKDRKHRKKSRRRHRRTT